MSSPERNSQDTRTKWRQIMQYLYPDALGRVYCLPPFYFNRVPVASSNVFEEPVQVLLPFGYNLPIPPRPVTSQPSGSELPSPGVHLTSQPSGSELPSPGVHLTSQPSGSELPSPGVHLTSQLFGSMSLPSSLWPRQESEFKKGKIKKSRMLESDARADFSQKHVLLNLEKLNEVMFIISELKFREYLNNPSFAKYTVKLPMSATSRAKDLKNDKQDDFDMYLENR